MLDTSVVDPDSYSGHAILALSNPHFQNIVTFNVTKP